MVIFVIGGQERQVFIDPVSKTTVWQVNISDGCIQRYDLHGDPPAPEHLGGP